jgi:phosphohistidine phosphatase
VTRGGRVGDTGRAVTGQRLYLLRHAKSSWTAPGLADHDRPLTSRGRRAAKAIGRHLRDQGIEPELVLCSSATRARETLERIGVGQHGAHVEPELYAAGAAALLARLHEVPAAVPSVMLIGHNPGLQELALLLSRSSPGVRELEAKFPTAALATLTLPGPGWSTLDRGTAELIDFVRPRDLE